MPGRRPRQQAFLGRLVAHLLDADDEHDVVHAAGDGHRADAERIRARRAGVLDARARDAGETDRGRHRVAADALLAPERPPLGGDERGVDLLGLEAAVDVGDRGLERARRHLLVALLEQLTELDEPGADHGDPVPAHGVLRYSSVDFADALRRPRLEPVDGDAAFVGVPAQHQLDLRRRSRCRSPSPTTWSMTRAPSSRSMTASGQRRHERRRHRVVDDERVHDAAAGQRDQLELRAPQLMQYGWIDGGVLIVPQSTQRAPRSPSISSAPRTNSALSGGTPIGMVSPAGRRAGPGAQHLGVRTRLPAGDGVGHGRRAADGAVGGDDDAGGASAAEADDGDGAGGVERGERAEERAAAPGVADARRTRSAEAGAAGAELRARPWRRGGRRGRGATTLVDLERGEVLADLAARPAGRSPRGTGGCRRGRGSPSRRRRGSGRGAGACG